MSTIYRVHIKYVDDNDNEICKNDRAYSNEEDAIAFLDERFHQLCDKFGIEELGVYEHKDDTMFQISEDGSSPYPQWVYVGEITTLELY